MQLWCATLILLIAFVASQTEAGCSSFWDKFRNKRTRYNAFVLLNEFLIDHVGPKDQLDVGIEAAREVIDSDVFKALQCTDQNMPDEEYRELISALAGLGLANSKDAIRCSPLSLINLKVLYEALRRSKERADLVKRVEQADLLLDEYLASIQGPCYKYLASEWNQKMRTDSLASYESYLRVFDIVNGATYLKYHPSSKESPTMCMLDSAIERGQHWKERSHELIGANTLFAMVGVNYRNKSHVPRTGLHGHEHALNMIAEHLIYPCRDFTSERVVLNVLESMAILVDLAGIKNSQARQLMIENGSPFIWLARLLTCQQLFMENPSKLATNFATFG